MDLSAAKQALANLKKFARSMEVENYKNKKSKPKQEDHAGEMHEDLEQEMMMEEEPELEEEESDSDYKEIVVMSGGSKKEPDPMSLLGKKKKGRK